MKKTMMLLVLFISTCTTRTVAVEHQEIQRCKNCQQRDLEDKKEVSTVLTNFAIMLTSLINIAQNPCATKEHLLIIANGLVNIAMLAINKGSNTQNIQKLLQSEEFIDQVNVLVRNTIESSKSNATGSKNLSEN